MIVRKPDPTWLKLSADADFQEFMRGYLQLLRENLKQVTVIDQRGNPRHTYYTCGQGHDLRIPMIPAGDSDGRRPAVPKQGGRFGSERSDAGFFLFSKSVF